MLMVNANRSRTSSGHAPSRPGPSQSVYCTCRGGGGKFRVVLGAAARSPSTSCLLVNPGLGWGPGQNVNIEKVLENEQGNVLSIGGCPHRSCSGRERNPTGSPSVHRTSGKNAVAGTSQLRPIHPLEHVHTYVAEAVSPSAHVASSSPPTLQGVFCGSVFG